MFTAQLARIPVKPDIPAHLETSQEHACRLDNGVETTSTAQVITCQTGFVTSLHFISARSLHIFIRMSCFPRVSGVYVSIVNKHFQKVVT